MIYSERPILYDRFGLPNTLNIPVLTLTDPHCTMGLAMPVPLAFQYLLCKTRTVGWT